MIGAIGGNGSDMLQMWKEKVAAADTDSSGGLSLDEFKALGPSDKAGGASRTGGPDPSELFSKLDADGNGELSAEESTPPPPPGPPPGGMVGGNAAMSMLLGMQEEDSDSASSGVASLISDLASSLIDAADTNGDGVVSAAEYAAQTQSTETDAFTAADADQDGSLNGDELASQLQDLLSQQLQTGGKRAYEQLLDVFSQALQSAQGQANSTAGVSVAA